MMFLHAADNLLCSRRDATASSLMACGNAGADVDVAGFFCNHDASNKKKKKKNKPRSLSLGSFIFIFILVCVTFMVKPVLSSSPVVVTSADQICGQTLDDPSGYDFSSFAGDIYCSGSGPKITNKILFDCAGKAIIQDGEDPFTIGIEVFDGSEVTNCDVSGFGHGIQVTSSSDLPVSVTNVVATNNVNGGFVANNVRGPVTFTSCTFENNFQGVVVSRDPRDAVFFNGCDFLDNRLHGATIYSIRRVKFDGGVAADNGRYGIYAVRYGGRAKLTILNMEIVDNRRGFGVGIFGPQPASEITGVVIASNGRGSIASFGVTSKVTCSDIFGYILGSVDDSGGGVCYTENSCGDRDAECAEYSLIVPE